MGKHFEPDGKGGFDEEETPGLVKTFVREVKRAITPR